MATNATTTIGTLTKNTDPHQKCSSRMPLDKGPIAPPAPANPAQIAIALPRSSGGKTTVMIDSVAGITSAAPTPITERKAMTKAAESANDATIAAVPKMARPVSSAPLRP